MNDERPIEKLLRRAAQKRHDEAGAPPELHPANRRLLQTEVARQFPQQEAAATPDAPARDSFWTLLTQRWSFALGFFVILGIAAVVILPLFNKPEAEFNLAQLPDADGLAMEALAPVPASAPASIALNDLAKATPSGGGKLAPTPEPAPPVATAVELAPATRELAAADERSQFSPPEERNAPLNRSTALASDALLAQSREAKTKAEAPALAESYSRVATDPTASRVQPARPADLSLGLDLDRNVVGRSTSLATAAPASALADSALATNRRFTGRAEAPRVATRTAADAVPANELADRAIDEVGAKDKTILPRGGGVEADRPEFTSQAFSNVSPELLARRRDAREFRALPPAVLTKFQVQQQGRDMQVIDSDGSIYKGVVDEANTLYKQVFAEKERQFAQSFDNRARFRSPKATDAVAPAIPAQSATTHYLYRVEGTNRTLNQNVVFTWNFVPTNDAIAAAQQDFKKNLLKSEANQNPSPFPELLQNSYIDGRAQLGPSRQVEVSAVPVKQ